MTATALTTFFAALGNDHHAAALKRAEDGEPDVITATIIPITPDHDPVEALRMHEAQDVVATLEVTADGVCALEVTTMPANRDALTDLLTTIAGGYDRAMKEFSKPKIIT